MGLILLAVMIAAAVLWSTNLGWKWMVGAWVVFILAGLVYVPYASVIVQLIVALTTAVRGVMATQSTSILDAKP